MPRRTLLLRLALLLAGAHCALCAPVAPSGGALPELPGPVRDSDPETFAANASRVGAGLLECPCSPSGRGFRGGTLLALVPRNASLGVASDDEDGGGGGGGTLREGGLAAAQKFAAGLLRGCARAAGVEACVNAAASLRRPGALALCLHDAESGRNVAPAPGPALVTLGRCDADPATRSPDADVASPGAGARPAADAPDAEPAPAETKPPDAKAEAAVARPLDEGCVAVEHLRGARLQHRRDLPRAVLCARGFCATPNHALEVDGAMTSMRELCAPRGKWRCVRSVKLVNNLRVAYHARWQVRPGLAVTPYDRRFPRAAIWAVQIAQDVAEIVLAAVAAGVAVAAVALLAHASAGAARIQR